MMREILVVMKNVTWVIWFGLAIYLEWGNWTTFKVIGLAILASLPFMIIAMKIWG